ncbi:D-alanyl-D-alanine carboxypeptidase family protein [Nonomuraea wenchangensis]|uniref:D-alanyl-D-alanine carboxypeptidase (Penicillin-binding protein 5/6) n=1 Tax=Nonomuraea wenchangensis TaxID=568860 RepID=A0A1I0LFY5_9ACTN|nr:D-alanyl-D-alanine carboxypeptidase [Nonomuraea wenchangensis]SEU38228.1 D-alanyl-D-alanine carboxypeptidase (penicillin-binding protein 5/6) [Nonomuraea wenchangensis]
MWTKTVLITAFVASASLTGGTAYAAPATPVGGPALGSRGLVAPEGVKKPPKTKATSYVIADVETGQVLAAKDAHGRYLPASTLKTLTALTLIPKLNKNLRIRPSQNACNQEGTAVGLTPKATYRVDDLFKGLMMSSGNDAAMALAEVNGGLAKTMREMNEEAKRLQANDTVAKTPSGLDKPGQSSSAYDLALIARAGLANPDFLRYISTKTANFPAPKGKTYQISNHNKLLWRYQGMIGVKNGWTSKALGSFVGAATRGGHTIVVSVMRHEGYFWEEVGKLMDWGFSVRGKVTPVGQLVDPLPAQAPAAPQARVSGGPVTQVTPAHQPPLLDTAAQRQTDHTKAVGAAVIGGGLLFGVVWLVYGIRRRRRGGSGV